MRKAELSAMVTLGIPFHEGVPNNHLEQAIKSILNQTVIPSEIHLIQDGEVSESKARVIRKYLEPNKITLMVNKKNYGLAYSLNRSIEQTKTKYYARMDSDDIALPQRIELQISYMEKNPCVDILGSWALEFKNDNYKNQKDLFLKKMPTAQRDIEAWFHFRNPLIHPTVVFRRSVFSKTGMYSEKFKSDQDLELWGRALKNNVKIANLPIPLLLFRTDNMIKKRSEKNRIMRQAKARFSYNTLSLSLNALKVMAIIFRMLPHSIREWGYCNLR